MCRKMRHCSTFCNCSLPQLSLILFQSSNQIITLPPLILSHGVQRHQRENCTTSTQPITLMGWHKCSCAEVKVLNHMHHSQNQERKAEAHCKPDPNREPLTKLLKESPWHKQLRPAVMGNFADAQNPPDPPCAQADAISNLQMMPKC